MSVSEPESPATAPADGEDELTTTGRIVSSKSVSEREMRDTSLAVMSSARFPPGIACSGL